MRTQLLDAWGVDRAILNPPTGRRSDNLELDAERARAANDRQVAEWLDKEPRLRGSIVIPHEDAALAVDEIERRAADKRFVQVQLPGRSRAPLGNRKYWPIYEAAERHGLPVMTDGCGGGGYPITGAGWPSFQLEEQVAPLQAMQANVISIVLEGVLERFPKLQVVCAENGFGWVPPLMWRLDGSWKVLKGEVPELMRPPSEYVRDHFWFCTQPSEPASYFGMDERILFASNYPRSDLDFPAKLSELFSENARRLHAARLS